MNINESAEDWLFSLFVKDSGSVFFANKRMGRQAT